MWSTPFTYFPPPDIQSMPIDQPKEEVTDAVAEPKTKATSYTFVWVFVCIIIFIYLVYQYWHIESSDIMNSLYHKHVEQHNMKTLEEIYSFLSNTKNVMNRECSNLLKEKRDQAYPHHSEDS